MFDLVSRLVNASYTGPMTAAETGHGFTRVDQASRPRDWVECLDKLHAEPFYRDYKRRVREWLEPRADGLYLEVGAGAGAHALAPRAPAGGVHPPPPVCPATP